MEIIFQYPIIDRRGIVEGNNALNVWPDAKMGKEGMAAFFEKRPFVRNFGEIKKSVVGFYCNINCVKYTALHTQGPRFDEVNTSITDSYKKLYSESDFCKKAEFYFKDNVDKLLYREVLKKTIQITDYLKHYAEMPVLQKKTSQADNKDIPQPTREYFVPATLAGARHMLANSYYYATVPSNALPATTDMVKSGDPCIVLIFCKHEKIALPENATLCESNIGNTGANLYAYDWNYDGQSFKVWLFELPMPWEYFTNDQRQALYEKRLYLLHTNAQKEATRVLVQEYKTGPAEERDKSELDKYLTKSTKSLLKAERFGSDQQKLIENALRGGVAPDGKPEENIDDETQRANIKVMMDFLRKQIPRKSVMFISSSPVDKRGVDFGGAYRSIKEALQKGSERDYYEILPELEVKKGELDTLFFTELPDYLHILLHNDPIEGLYFQDDNRESNAMPIELFAGYIQLLVKSRAARGLPKPRAIVLCACNSKGHALAVKDLCEYVMGTNYVFPEEAAIEYSRKFYEALFNGQKIPLCHDAGKQGINAYKMPWERDGHNVSEMPELTPPT